MNWFNNLKIRSKLFVSFTILMAIAVFIAYEGYTSISNLIDSESEFYFGRVEPLRDLGRAQAALLRARGDIRNAMLTDVLAERNKYISNTYIDFALVDSLMKIYSQTKMTKAEEENLAIFKQAYAEYMKLRDEIVPHVRQFEDKQALVISNGPARAAMLSLQTSLVKLIDINASEAKRIYTDDSVSGRNSKNLMVVFLILSILLSGGLAILLTRLIGAPLYKTVNMIVELQKGHLGNRLGMTFNDEVGTMAKAMDSFADDLQNNVVRNLLKISEGDINIDVVSKDDKDEISPALKRMVNTLSELTQETKILAKAAVDGKLATRGNVSKFNGAYRDIVQGMNDTLDSVIGPLNVAAEYVDRIAKGDIPKKITDNYNGDFNEIKNNLNTCIDAVNTLVSDAGVLSKAAVEGKLATRADASKHQGDFRKIVQGVNDTLDSVIGPLNVAAEYVDRIAKGDIPNKITDNYNGDFNEIKNNLNTCIDAVNTLVSDAGVLSKAAVEGRLATRADASKHQGDFRKIVQGVNDTLDSVIGPLNVAAEYVDRIAKGDIPNKITDNYNGDF
ncbi:MAG: MCP four helix bundle domain-containing protein, partial [Ignavibacteria bacterium]|nr:MCP four helix bundle domain-containing protein [Ignavibacteria bacterium]